MIEIDIADRQQGVVLDTARLRKVTEAVLREEGRSSAEISIAVVGNGEMHELNRRYLDHDWTTDVLSFCFDEEKGTLSGELILNADLAAEAAAEYGWKPQDELLLYLVHGLLHLCGYDDREESSLSRMRRREAALLATWGLHPVYDGRGLPGKTTGTGAPSGEE